MVLDGKVDQHRDAHYYNDVIELDKSAVQLGDNVLAVLVYNNRTVTHTFFDAELEPRPVLTAEEREQLALDSGDTCAPGTLNCECIDERVVDSGDGDDGATTRSVCVDGLQCDQYLHECVLSWDDSFNPETVDANDGALTVEDEQRTHVAVAGYCKQPGTVCCVPAHAQSDPDDPSHDLADSFEPDGTQLPSNEPLGEGMEPEPEIDLNKPLVASGEEAVKDNDASTSTAAFVAPSALAVLVSLAAL